MTLEEARMQFPQLEERVYGKPLVYLDHAATSLRPLSVVRCWEECSLKRNANLHRAVHFMAAQATEAYEAARAAVADYIGAASPREIVFTSGATASINLLAASLGRAFYSGGALQAEPWLKPGDRILVAESEHHSDIVPWQLLCERLGTQLEVLPVEEDGTYSLERLARRLENGVKLFCIAQISNVLGVINPIADMAQFCHATDCRILVDGAQGAVHLPIDVQALGIDYYVFSGHKLYAAPGTGVLYARAELLEQLPPYMGGGEMIGTVRWSGSTWAEVPHRFEAGTQNLAGVPTFVPALSLLRALREGPLEGHFRALRDRVWDRLKSIPGLRIFGTPADREQKIALFSFSVEGVHHEDLALILDKMGIAVRSGQMCAEPLMDRYAVTGMLRASFAPFNTMEEADYFVDSLEKAIGMLR